MFWEGKEGERIILADGLGEEEEREPCLVRGELV